MKKTLLQSQFGRARLCGGAVLLILAMPIDASAEEWNFTIGLGAGVAPDYEGSDDYEAVPIPFVRADFGARFVELSGTTLRANVLTHPTFSAGPVINVRGERDDVEEDAVDDLDQVDTAVELGAFAEVFYQGWLGNLTVTQDVADGHDGMLVSLSGGFLLPLSPQLALTTLVSGTYADDDYMDSYFGIGVGDAIASGLDEFDADAGVKDIGLTFELAYEYSSSWGVTGTASYQRLLDDAADSPVVDDVGDENQFLGGVVVSYSF